MEAAEHFQALAASRAEASDQMAREPADVDQEKQKAEALPSPAAPRPPKSQRPPTSAADLEALWQTGALSLTRAERLGSKAMDPDGGQEIRVDDEVRGGNVQVLAGSGSPWVVVPGPRGVRYSFDITKCMFSEGNAAEKERVAAWPVQGETILDMSVTRHLGVAGHLGVSETGVASRTQAEHVFACEWNPHALEGLREGLRLLGAPGSCEVLAGDNRRDEVKTLVAGKCHRGPGITSFKAKTNLGPTDFGFLLGQVQEASSVPVPPSPLSDGSDAGGYGDSSGMLKRCRSRGDQEMLVDAKRLAVEGLQPPIVALRPQQVLSGFVEGEDRGSNLMDPPVVRTDPFSWLRDDTHQNDTTLEGAMWPSVVAFRSGWQNLHLSDTLLREMRSHEKDSSVGIPSIYPGGYAYYSRGTKKRSYQSHFRARVVADATDSATRGQPVPADVAVLAEVINLKLADEEWASEESLTRAGLRRWQETDKRFSVNISKTSDERFLVIQSASSETAESYMLDLQSGDQARLLSVCPRDFGIHYEIDHCNGFLYIMTDKDAAVARNSLRNSKLCRTPLSSIPSQSQHWEDVWVPEPHVHLDSFQCFEKFIALTGRQNGASCIYVMLLPEGGGKGPVHPVIFPDARLGGLRARGNAPSTRRSGSDSDGGDGSIMFSTFLSFPARTAAVRSTPRFPRFSWRSQGMLKSRGFLTTPHTKAAAQTLFSVSLGGNDLFKTDTLRLHYTSYTIPGRDYNYHESGPEHYDASLYRAEQIFSKERQVPISLVYRTDLHPQGLKGGPFPTLLTGYGAYGACQDPGFDSNLLCLLDRGVIYAVAHVRGGGELGRDWREEGRYLKVKNRFQDFIAVAETLIALGISEPSTLGAWGESSGGLLVTASVNLRPELFKAMLLYVPFVDAVSTMSDPSSLGRRMSCPSSGRRV
eukprot:g21174.t1